SDAALKYQWKANGEKIGTNSTTLAIPGAAVGKAITVEVTATGYEGNLTTSATNAVAKKAVTATVGTVSKVYDGTAAVETADRTLTITKVNASDDITVTAPSAKYNDASVNIGKTITLGDLSISGTAADWYDVTAPTTVTGTITVKALTDATVTVGGTYTYTGTEQTPT
ncbi:MAG: YDG domain-containing protein, partial [Lachnospiraceae bacterium]